jgi:anti-sigma regulatory factor (Ser/Thr protein kinase)/CheY-like chemotaxis protein
VRSRCLMVFDPDPGTHGFLDGVLRKAGHSIQDAYDSREVLEVLRHQSCDLILAGQGRNGSHEGLKLLRKIRALRPETKVILTGDQDPVRVLSAIRARAYSYFHRPIAAGPLADMVQQALHAESWQDDLRVISARPEWITLEIRCKLDAAERTTQFTRELLCKLPRGVCEDIAASFRELLMNAIEHGGKSDPAKRVRASLLRTGRSVIVHISDPGRGFSLDSLPHAAISNPEDSPTKHVELRAEQGKRPGGFGILMARNMVDELVYNERGNAVLFVKYLR